MLKTKQPTTTLPAAIPHGFGRDTRNLTATLNRRFPGSNLSFWTKRNRNKNNR